MEKLRKMLECVKMQEKNRLISIPSDWNYLSLPCQTDSSRPGECWVRERDYFVGCLEFLLQSPARPKTGELSRLHVYAMLMRTFSAWDKGDGVEEGTLLQTICLLPLLQEMGIRAIYLLPVFQMSGLYRKGELPSPYAIRNIRKISSELHHPLLSEMTPEEEFSAFVECCHHLGFSVLLDFVFRTVARDNDLLEEHPEYFYWIHKEREEAFAAPGVAGRGHTVPNPDVNRLLYQSPDMAEYLRHFAPPPTPEEWRRVKDRAEKTGENLLTGAGEELSLVTMPGFADTINDPQPPWTDITFLKLYEQPTPFAKEALDVSQLPPFIAQDGVKCSSFQGEDPVTGLWDYIEGVIPFYIEQYGIDGARIDMAHALPTRLMTRVVQKARQLSPKFLLWSEEFISDRAAEVRSEGYDVMTGGIWDRWDRFGSESFNQELLECLTPSLPVVSALETADTPRSRLFLEEDEAVCALFLCCLLPGTVACVNNGQELGEIQPMNLGLKNTEAGRFVLPADHPFYGKLSFFDHYSFQWTKGNTIRKSIRRALELREQLLPLMEYREGLDEVLLGRPGLQTSVVVQRGEEGFAALFHRGREPVKLKKADCFPTLSPGSLTPLYSKLAEDAGEEITLRPGGLAVYHITKNRADTQEELG